MTTCTVRARQQANYLASLLDADCRVVSVDDPIPPQQDPTGHWTVEAKIDGGCGGFPMEIARPLEASVIVRARRYNGMWRALLFVQ